jgi:tellurium resistance protein TerZ
MLDLCYFNNLVALQGVIVHSGDSRDGISAGEDEVITIDLSKVPPHVLGLFVTVHCYSEGDLSSCKTARASFSQAGTAVFSTETSSFGKHTSAVLALIQRQPNGTWSILPQTLTVPVRTPTDCLSSMLSLMHVDPVLQKELKSKQPVFNMQKGSNLSVPCNMHSVGVGLGWDSQVDVDGSAIILGPGGQFLDSVSFSHLTSNDKSIKHSGDNTTGVGSGDDEVISVQLDQVSANVTHIFFVVNVYSGGSFANVKGEFIRLFDRVNGAELCRFNTMDNGNFNGFIFACMYRDPLTPGWWKYLAIGDFAMGRVCRDLVDKCQALQLKWAAINPAPVAQLPSPIGTTAPTRQLVSACPTSGTISLTLPLHIKLIEARNLKACDAGGTSDPYVRIKQNGRVLHKTRVVKKTLSPVWNDDYCVVTEPGSVEFEVMDEDFLKDDHMGNVNVVLPYSGPAIPEWFDVTDASGIKCGQVHIQFHK